jgi:catechol 2,3-dioxygenase-like lactoylglutathione lyase family enzyme
MSSDFRLEVVQVPVADVDRAKAFYVDQAGFTADHDTQISDTMRVVQLTPRGSACSIVIGTGLNSMAPGSVEGLQLVTTDMDAARAELVERGVDVSDVIDMGRPGGQTTFKFANFTDPDGNAWVLQEIPS